MAKYNYVVIFLLFCVRLAVFGNHVEDSDELDDETMSTKYMLVGSETEFRMFEGFPVDDLCSSLTAVEFEYVEFDPQVLTQSLKGCDRLEKVHLHEVEWIGNFTSRVFLPNLKDFILFRSRGFHDFDKDTLKSVLFFDKSESEDWDMDEIHLLGTNITTEHFHLNHQSGALYSSLDLTNDMILKNLGDQFPIRKLSLDHIEVSADRFPRTLESLTLQGVEVVGRVKLDEIFKRTQNLKYLNLAAPLPNILDMSKLPVNTLETMVLNNVQIVQTSLIKFHRLSNLSITSCLIHPEHIPESVTFLEMDDSFVHGANFKALFERTKNLKTLIIKRPTPSYLDISNLPIRTLTELHLENMNLAQSRHIFTFPNLRIFTCHDCDLDQNIVDHFHTIFKDVEVFDIWFRNLRLPYYEILAKTIYKTASKRIEISDLQREPGARGRHLDFDTVENVLQEARVPGRAMTFIIEKDLKTGQWQYIDPMEAVALERRKK